MTRVDFYLAQDDAADGALLACRLAEKAFKLGHGAYIYTTDAAASRQLDTLLWTWSQGSFVPHAVYDGSGAGTDRPFPVLIGHVEPPLACHDVLISLNPQVPPFFSRFERVAEVVGADETERASARERFRFYRERGYPLQTHEV